MRWVRPIHMSIHTHVCTHVYTHIHTHVDTHVHTTGKMSLSAPDADRTDVSKLTAQVQLSNIAPSPRHAAAAHGPMAP